MDKKKVRKIVKTLECTCILTGMLAKIAAVELNVLDDLLDDKKEIGMDDVESKLNELKKSSKK